MDSITNTNGPSLAQEHAALEQWGDRKTRTILAVFHARRLAKSLEFFVSPKVAEFHNLKPKDLNWGLERLEGKLTITVEQRKGRFRRLRLLPCYEASTTNYIKPTINDSCDEEQIVVDTAAVLARVAGLE
ncbi:hypothetical protein OAF99_02805 [Akkermansiaceae bacterium]|nr:hypothetical protein [Akkermansiaceae bacterium]